MSAYDLLFRTVLRRIPAERAHHLGALVIRALGAPGVRTLVRRVTAPHPELRLCALGREFSSPFGLAAGFDKNAELIEGLTALGFGHVEVGTLTPRPQPGNPAPRLFRLVDDRALINRMGFNNDGVAAARPRLARRRTRQARVGVNIGRNKATPNELAADDYALAARELAPFADYLAVNVSSPNTPGLRGLQDREALEPLIRRVLDESAGRPVLVKIAPDLDDDAVRDVARLANDLDLAGVIATNTTLAREGLREGADRVRGIGAGGLSGEPLRQRALEVLRTLAEQLDEDRVLISVGGVSTAEDVQARLDAGATLVQGYTAFLYEGPFWARRVNRGLARIRGLR